MDQIVALLDGDHARAAQVITELDSSPLTTFTTLLVKEDSKQAADKKKADTSVVDDNQCKR